MTEGLGKSSEDLLTGGGGGCGFPLVYYFHRHQAQSSKSIGRVIMHVAQHSQFSLRWSLFCLFPPSLLGQGAPGGNEFAQVKIGSLCYSTMHSNKQ